MNREDFKILNNDIIYLDNAATTLKPKSVTEKINEYYNSYSANAHRGDYDISLKVDMEYENARDLVKDFINASSRKEIIFTSGTTQSLNMIVFGYFKKILKSGDEIILTKSEHASNILPWFVLAKELNLVINYIELDVDYSVKIEKVQEKITPQTKVISIAGVTNVIGDTRPIKKICKLAHQNNILVIVDAAQLVAHQSTDVQELDCDFLAFSAHKMCGPTGVGVLYGKYDLLKEMNPQNYGGGMNESFDEIETMSLKELPGKLEAGTQNIAGVIGFGETIKYLSKIGMDNIKEYENKLSEYLVQKLSEISHIEIINKNTKSNIITFNVEDIFSQDVTSYLNKYNICLRAGNHCAKKLKDETGINSSCRISLYFYNTYEEMDILVNLLKDKNKILMEMF